MTSDSKTFAAPDPAQILRDRARALARPAQPAVTTETIEVLQFALAEESYAVETRHVTEVYPLRELTPLPCTPPFVRGVVNVRGRILPVLDVKRFFDLPDQGLTDLHRIILVRGADLEFGLLADTVAGVRRIFIDDLQASLPTLTGIGAEYLKGVTGERLVVLDVARIVADPAIVVHEEVES